MEARAVQRYVRSSPKKMRIVVNLLRGKPVSEALNTLNFLPQKAAETISIAIQSAVQNLMYKHSDERIDEESLIVREIFVDGAPSFKRIQPAPRGRAHRILKRNSHLTVVIGTPQKDA